MYEIECTYASTAGVLSFFPAGSGERSCYLSVTFEPIDWYPAEPDVGAGHDFDAQIVSVDMYDGPPDDSGSVQRHLTGLDLDQAKAFLEEHHRDEMWAVAEALTAEAFGKVAA